MSEEVKNKIKKIVADHLGIEEEKVTEEASFIDDLGADSLDTCAELYEMTGLEANKVSLH